MVNRGAVIVRPLQPYIDWALNLDNSGLAPEYDGEQTVYLIPEYDDDVDSLSILSQCYELIFEEELNGWHIDESVWPKNRTFKMFREWFEIEFHSTVDDICGYPLEDDDV